jgi:hypothetical protein
MSAKKLALSWLVVFICVTVLNFLIHGILLSGDYQALPQLMRPPVEGPKYMPYMIFAFAVYALAMVWIYAQGAKPGTPWLGQGIRFGIAVWALTSVPMYLIYYTVQPWLLGITLKQIGLEFFSVVIYGIVTAAMYGKGAGQARASTAGN